MSAHASLSDSPPRLDSGMGPAGHRCSKCRQREATIAWGDIMTINHGGGEWRCDVCQYTEQLEHARERAKAIPALECKLAAALEKDA